MNPAKWWKFLRFAVIHSLRDMWRNRGRTVFALLCVATGVAAVVALRSLAFMVGDKLTTSLAELNRGDIRVYASRGVPELVELSQQNSPIFTQDAETWLREWADDVDVGITFARLGGGGQLRAIWNGRAVTARPVVALYVEPEDYPFYDVIRMSHPRGETLLDVLGPMQSEGRVWAETLLPRLGGMATMLSAPGAGVSGGGWMAYSAWLAAHPRPIVISNNLTREVGMSLHVDDIVRVGAADTLYRVVGVARSDSETVISNPPAAFIGNYVYLPLTDLRVLGDVARADQVFVQVPVGRDVAGVEANLIEMLQTRSGAETDFTEELNRASVPELEEQNAEVADVIDDMILVLGLSSLLIGGIGIVNTMLVVVNRRTLEIAVLKTLGLKGYRVTFLFLVEAVLMGIIGSVIGIVLGVILSYVIKDVGETAFSSLSLEWRLYPVAMFSGLFLGMVMTVLFGFLPTLIAGQVRPAIVLRPNEAQMPAAGLLQTLATIVVMIVVLGLLVGTIVEGAITFDPVAMITGAGALVGVFAGIIIANTGIGSPIPDYYVFRLPRRFEVLENRLTGAVGWLVGWLPRWRGLPQRERGQQAITVGLRGLRQGILLYGGLAIGAALASGILLLASELWLPFGAGNVKPANDVVAALDRGDLVWVLVWLVMLTAFAAIIRRWAGTLAGLIALASLGVTFGGTLGALLGVILRVLLDGSSAWQTLSEVSTGIVLVEGALVLLGAIYVGYWLLVWGLGKLPLTGVMGLVSLTLVVLIGGIAAAVSLAGIWALALLVIAAAAFALVLWLWAADAEPGAHALVPVPGLPREARRMPPGTSAVMWSVAAVSGGFLAVDVLGSSVQWSLVLVTGIVLVGLWIFLRRKYAIDGRLILREMAGRRGRAASTLLGLSVGVAGLSLVSLTTNAASSLLSIQLDESAEGNLVIADYSSQYGEAITTILSEAEGVESYSQVTTYIGVLTQINGKKIEPRRAHRPDSEADDPRENSNLEVYEDGVPMGLTERVSLDDMPDYDMDAGRALRPGDEDANLIMIRESFITEQFDIQPGDRLMFRFENRPGEDDDVLQQFRVAGIISRNSEQMGLEEFGNLSVVPPGALMDTVRPEGIATIAQIDESDDRYMDRVLVAISDVPGVIALELSALTQLAEDLLNQLKAIPTLVAWLALVAGTAIIANTVALATQERRRQIGVMKAIGLKGRRVLIMLMIENGLIGLIAGLIGAGIGFMATVILVLSTPGPGELQETIDFGVMGWLVLMSVGVAVGASMISAWSAAAEKPMNVLRYE